MTGIRMDREHAEAGLSTCTFQHEPPHGLLDFPFERPVAFMTGP